MDNHRDPGAYRVGDVEIAVAEMHAMAKEINQRSTLHEMLGFRDGRLFPVIVGLGKTGVSIANFLASRGVDFSVNDSRMDPPGLSHLTNYLPDVPVYLGGFDPNVIKKATHLMVSPGVSLQTPAITKAILSGKPILSDIDIFAHYTKAPIVAITGANGKSTVTTLLGLMAEKDGKKARVGGNLGVPALDLIETDEPDLYILELSSFQLERTSRLRAAVATILNISPDHMDRHQDLRSYAEQKRRIFFGDGVMVLNGDDSIVREMARSDRHCVFFGVGSERFDYHLSKTAAEEWLVGNSLKLLKTEHLKLRGMHNLSNALAALALGESIGLSVCAMQQALREFSGLKHRMQPVAQIDGVQFINDSKATNIGACRAALEGLSGQVVLIAGGDSKGADLSALAQVVKEKVRAAVLIGKDADLLRDALADTTNFVNAGSMGEAVVAAKNLAENGDTVLLSPACSSLDQYSSYQERGQKFIDAVLRISS